VKILEVSSGYGRAYSPYAGSCDKLDDDSEKINPASLSIETRQKLFQDVIDEPERRKSPSCRPMLCVDFIAT
jgi:hypothetical protein